ncbi:hypothetical protein PV702_30600, partial [Streptomyces sp. FL06-04B]
MALAISATARPGAAAVKASGTDCPEARAGIERLEGRITPNVCAFRPGQPHANRPVMPTHRVPRRHEQAQLVGDALEAALVIDDRCPTFSGGGVVGGG